MIDVPDTNRFQSMRGTVNIPNVDADFSANIGREAM
jgi:hypothetical protein